ncbi:DUF3783 domain-containing protein [Clostridium sp. AM58-1XD]|uniref:DUF3783 domain-containing protein n=1 Tax=Clostridium sp. AM58-1XD TaxID=2292307 RepID=UPI000E4DABA2|nr:DUF3783 domain-containing protein [Clostridium sp. AM58-1XD]RGY97703.1 DUF3783 domain-containing protein [Clostridium sp. AM58-1XD]
MKARETVLYYAPEKTERTARLKGVFVRLGLRIKNISQDETGETVGYLAGLSGYGPAENTGDLLPIPEEMMVMKDFTSSRIDELLLAVRKAGLSKIELKAVLTESNAGWTFYHLYEEIKEEHEKMTGKGNA